MVCQTVDIVTTIRALKLNSMAYETNALPVPLLVILKLGLMYYVWNSKAYNEEHEAPRIAINALSCAPIPDNLKASKKVN